jgi:hypothetical protein
MQNLRVNVVPQLFRIMSIDHEAHLLQSRFIVNSHFSKNRYFETIPNKALDIAVGSGLTRRETDGSMRFEHHRLLEYLAASHWEKQKLVINIQANHLENPWWRETLMLRAGIATDPDHLVRDLYSFTAPQYLQNLIASDNGRKAAAALSA